MLLYSLTFYKNSNYKYSGKDAMCVLDSWKIWNLRLEIVQDNCIIY